MKRLFRRIGRALQRRAINRRIQDWGDRVEQLDRQQRNHAGNMELAVTEMQRAKRELAALDLPTVRVSCAPGRGRTDGIRRFSLTEDRPQAKASAGVTVMFPPRKARRA